MPNACLGLVECAHHRGAIEHVGRDRDGTAARLFDARLHRGELLLAAADQRDRRAFARQHLGEAHAEPARRAGDQRDAALEVEQFRRTAHAAPGAPVPASVHAARALTNVLLSTSNPARRILDHHPQE